MIELSTIPDLRRWVRAERAAGRAHAQLPVSSTRASSDGGRVVEVMRRV